MAILKRNNSSTATKVFKKRVTIPDVVLKPVVSEKSSQLETLGQYMFAVSPRASKVEVKKAIEVMYGVHVVGVNSVRLPGKTVRRGKITGRTKARRHMIVRLSKGETLSAKI